MAREIWLFPTPFRVERLVASPLPHRPVRADFPHTVPPKPVSLIDICDIFLVPKVSSILLLVY